MLLTQAYHYNVSVSRRADHVFAETIPGSKMTRVPFWPFTWFFTLATFQWWIRSYTTVDINRSPDLPISHCRYEATEGRGGVYTCPLPQLFSYFPMILFCVKLGFFWQIFSKIFSTSLHYARALTIYDGILKWLRKWSKTKGPRTTLLAIPLLQNSESLF